MSKPKNSSAKADAKEKTVQDELKAVASSLETANAAMLAAVTEVKAVIESKDADPEEGEEKEEAEESEEGAEEGADESEAEEQKTYEVNAEVIEKLMDNLVTAHKSLMEAKAAFDSAEKKGFSEEGIAKEAKGLEAVLGSFTEAFKGIQETQVKQAEMLTACIEKLSDAMSFDVTELKKQAGVAASVSPSAKHKDATARFLSYAEAIGSEE